MLHMQAIPEQLDAVRSAGDLDCHFDGILAQLGRELGVAIWDHVEVTADSFLSDEEWRDQIDLKWLTIDGCAVNWCNDRWINSHFQIFVKNKAVITSEEVIRTHINMRRLGVPRIWVIQVN
jgi:hypothetical protein